MYLRSVAAAETAVWATLPYSAGGLDEYLPGNVYASGAAPAVHYLRLVSTLIYINTITFLGFRSYQVQ